MSGGANTNAVKARIEALWAKGSSVPRIADQVGCPVDLVSETVRKFRRHSLLAPPTLDSDDAKHFQALIAQKCGGFPWVRGTRF